MTNEIQDVWLQKLADKSLRVGIIGLGYVGLPLSIRFCEEGFTVVGFDIDPDKVEKLLAGESYIKHIEQALLGASISQGLLQPTTDFSRAADCDALILCVPTPLTDTREPDLTYVRDTLDSLLPHMRPGQLISLESTTYPGTTEEEVVPRMEGRGLVVGDSVFVVYSPEREDPANPDFTTKTIPKVCGGVTESCRSLGVALYERVVDEVVSVSSTRVAEMTKLLENIHRAVNIGLVNELKVVADRMDINIYEVIAAASTKPFGFVPYYPGPGLGGHCIPIDPFYLTWKAREYGVNTRFIELAGEVNRSMPEYVVSKVVDGLNTKSMAVRGSKVLVLGVAYKPNVDDMRESPALEIIELLRDKGALVDYSDPWVPAFPKLRKHSENMTSVDLDEQIVAGYDCVVLATNHNAFDYDMIVKSASLIVDSRGRFPTDQSKVVPA